MQRFLIRILRQPQVAIVTGIAVAAATVAAATLGAPAFPETWTVVLAGGLMVAAAAAYRFPIYIRHNTKICIVSIPLFLMATLLSPFMAVCVAVLGLLAGELAVKSQRGTSTGDVVANTGRLALATLASSCVAHVPLPADGSVLRDLPLLGAAAVLWLGDAVTLPLVLVPITGEKPGRIVSSAVREGGAVEAAQYLMGMLGTLLAMQEIWTTAMLIVPAGLVYLAYKKEVDTDSFHLLEGLADTIDLRDPYTGGHSHRVAALVEGTLRELGMTGMEANQIITAARLHDVGKIAMPDKTLLKPGPLSPDDWRLMQTCPQQADELLRDYPDFSRGIEMIRHHHERWDGTGYPDRLAGTDIPFGARVIAVADGFDAMTSDRPYRRALTPEQATQVLIDGAGRQWDPQIVSVFLRAIAGELPTAGHAAELEIPPAIHAGSDPAPESYVPARAADSLRAVS